MFTGLVEALGSVVSLDAAVGGSRLVLAIPFASELALGDSVAVNGCCLTVASIDGDQIAFDLLGQTLDVTSLGALASGMVVNLERAMKAGDRFGGHFVQGHIDAVGKIHGIEARGQDHVVDVELPDEIARLCIEKGSLAIDGISLTIASLTDRRATFWITPHTWEHTNLHAVVSGQRVNLEADMLAKHVDRLLAARMNAGA
ncbi:MAG: riboflavin synthase [Verrucomicrobia bacterium]|nr:riboflavin synthase [Verrucomicrobiota bacterium]